MFCVAKPVENVIPNFSLAIYGTTVQSRRIKDALNRLENN